MDSNEKTNFLDDLTLQLQLQLSSVNKNEMFLASNKAANFNSNFSQFLNSIQTANAKNIKNGKLNIFQIFLKAIKLRI